MKLEWNQFERENVYRARVFGGWLLKTADSQLNVVNFIFVPDPNNLWSIPIENKISELTWERDNLVKDIYSWEEKPENEKKIEIARKELDKINKEIRVWEEKRKLSTK